MYLYSTVAPVSYDDVSIDVHSHSGGGVELAISFPVRAEFQHQFSLKGENLSGHSDASGLHGDKS